ncbi:MmcQ/YjbR family DNA-binding protein [Actinomadura keratinilytica]
MVTIEDILEEIVGEITDEYDRELPPVEELGEGRCRVTARLDIGDLGRLYGLESYDDEDVETVGGLLAKALGRVPIAGAARSSRSPTGAACASQPRTRPAAGTRSRRSSSNRSTSTRRPRPSPPRRTGRPTGEHARERYRRRPGRREPAGLLPLLQRSRRGVPLQPGDLRLQGRGKVFALTDLGADPLKISLKCDPDEAVRLRAAHPEIVPGWHLNKRHWNTVTVAPLPPRHLRELIEDSYDLVVAGLPRAVRLRLDRP